MTCAAALHEREVGYQILEGKFRSKNDLVVDIVVDIVRWTMLTVEGEKK